MTPNTISADRGFLRKLARWFAVCGAALAVFTCLLAVQIFFITGYPFSKAGLRDFICEAMAYESRSPPVIEVRGVQNDAVHSIFLFETKSKIKGMLGEPERTVAKRWYIVPAEAWVYHDVTLVFFAGKLGKIGTQVKSPAP